MYRYIKFDGKDYPNDRENGWSHELNGVTHDKDNWYFTANGVLWKIPIKEDLNQYFKGEDKSRGILRKELTRAELFEKYQAYDYDWKKYVFYKQHMGDIDWYDRYIFVPYSADLGCDNSTDKLFNRVKHEVLCIAVFDTKTLALVSTHVLKRHDGKGYSHMWWVAINPTNGLLYTADGHLTEASYIYVYEIGDCTKNNTITLHSMATLWYETGTRMERRHMQGGCFDGQNYLHLINGKWTGTGHDYSDGTKGGIAIYRPSESPQKGSVEKLYRLSHSEQDGSFAFKFSGEGEEPEGITYWDLDQDKRAPRGKKGEHIPGQLHAIMLDNVGVNKDDFFFKHYCRNQTAHYYQVTVNCGDNLGVAGSAEIGITLYGAGESTPRDTMKVTYNYLDKNWQNTRIIVGDKIGELQEVQLSILKTSKASKLYIESVDVVEVETGHTYHCPGNLWIERSNNPLIRFFLKAIPSVSNLGSVVLNMGEPRPGYWAYVKCKPGSGIRDVPRNKVTDQWQRSPDGKSGWVNVAGRQEEPKRNLGVYSLYKDDVGYYLRALITVEGYAGTLTTEPVKILQPTLDAWRSTADQHVKLSPEKPRPGDTITAKLSSLFDGMKIHYRWRWAADTSDYYHTRSTDKTYTVTKDDLGGRIDLDITADGCDGGIISAAVQIVKN